MPVLGTGGFGQVYKYTSGSGPRLAIKEETKVSIQGCFKLSILLLCYCTASTNHWESRFI